MLEDIRYFWEDIPVWVVILIAIVGLGALVIWMLATNQPPMYFYLLGGGVGLSVILGIGKALTGGGL